uniref:Uncharacterized protein n=1 Tax=Brassica oleracea TaxID=3712 RepID=A0A3P6FX82_BRAOL|nr:unnamed protein product [Brassica oleracea]
MDCRKLEMSKGPSVISKSGGVMCFNETTLKHIKSSKWLWHPRGSVMNQIVDGS